MYKLIYASLVPVIILGILFASCSCSKAEGEGFAIYLTKDDIPPTRLPVLSYVNIEEQPLIGVNDIVKYDAGTHEITLTSNAYKKITDLEVPVSGKSFIVCVDKQIIYSGAFWTPLSSLSYDGITICMPLGSQETNVIHVELGYPSSSFYTGEDTRDNPKIMESLKRDGKLSETTEKLPHSMKGYELYSWTKNSLWYFTLVTGTNRNKTLAEIVTGTDNTEDGWVNLNVVGINALKAVLRRLPEKEWVFWASDGRLIYSPEDTIQIAFPDQLTMDNIKEYAIECRLDFTLDTF